MVNKAYNFLRETRTFFLATAEGNNPKIRPFGALSLIGGKLYFVTSNTKDVFRQLQKNPAVSVCACNANREWIRIEGTAIIDKSTAAKQKMLDDNPTLLRLKRYTSATDPNMEVFYIDKPTIIFY